MFPVQLLPVSRSMPVLTEEGPVVEGVVPALFDHPARFLFLGPFFLDELVLWSRAPAEFAAPADKPRSSSPPTAPASCWALASTPTPSPDSSSASTAKAFNVSYNSKRELFKSAVGSAETPLEFVGGAWAALMGEASRLRRPLV